jgi:hypothetical protein
MSKQEPTALVVGLPSNGKRRIYPSVRRFTYNRSSIDEFPKAHFGQVPACRNVRAL